MIRIEPIADTPEKALRLAGKYSPYLLRLNEQLSRPDFSAALSAMREAGGASDTDTSMPAMRRAKRLAHLALAGLDLSGQRSVMEITRDLSDLADAAVQSAMSVALRARGLSPDGLFGIALGKMGAHELNYSSDIDFVILYDPATFEGGARGPADAAMRVARDMVHLLDERTADGYVFRTDLRLRPDPGSTPLAVSTDMAQLYYESVGQNWERMVWIKARACAGDLRAAADFLETMQPFIWRRHMDYWAISDIHAIKRMVNAKVGADGVEDIAPDLKLGPGGIREIEFFAQTQQLIIGGRRPGLRQISTLDALAALADETVIDKKQVAALSEAYQNLRAVEHRVQMIQDQQTHNLPGDDNARSSIAALCGYRDLSEFDRDVLATRRLVHQAYSDLFVQEDHSNGDDEVGNLVFTGVDDDPGTVETLTSLGFSDPSAAIETIRNWHRGRVPATRTERGRGLLTTLLPPLLQAMSRTGEADTAFLWFSRFFEELGSGVQTISMLISASDLLDDVVATLALAPRLASVLSRRPDLLESLIGGAAPESFLPNESDTGFEDKMNAARRYVREQGFLIGHRLLHGRLAAREAAGAWTALADDTIRAMTDAALEETARRFGPPPGRAGVFAMGKLGGQEMTAGSDLDLIIIYDADDDETGAAQSWFTRFTQRLIAALSAPTAEGMLYEVDMRLRPSGRAGPVAVSLTSFEHYQNEDAWTWEHMALTRLRFVAGDSALGETALRIAGQAIIRRAGRSDITSDIIDMHQRLNKEKPGNGLWDMKLGPGAMMDIEFILQHAQLQAGDAQLITANSIEALAALIEVGALDKSDGGVLADALQLFQSVQQVQRIAISGEFIPAQASIALKDRLCRAAGIADFGSLEEEILTAKTRVKALFAKKIASPATD